MRPRGASIIAAALLVLASATVAAAQELKLRVYSPAVQSRTLAPIPLEIELKWSGSAPLQGRLELVCEHLLTPFVRVTTDELVVPPGGSLRTRVYVPGLRYGIAAEFADARARFLTDAKSFDLGVHNFPLPPNGRRFVVLLAGEVGGANNSADFLDALRLERFDPRPDAVNHRTVPARLRPRELPTNPLEYCAYDVVVLRGEALSEMTQAQLDALLAWVRGGGALWAIPTGRLETEQTLFLDTLAARGEPPMTFTADRFGRVTTTDETPPDWIGTYRVDLGRAVISLQEPATQGAAAAETTRAVHFLWRVRESQATRAETTGRWDVGLQRLSTATRYQPPNGVIRFDPDPELIADPLLDALLPRQIRLVPLSAVIWLMIAFLVAVGPLDYFLLGALRKRKLTWVLFPLLVIAFAVAMVKTAGHYMGGATDPRSLTIIDVGDDGREVRRFRLDLRLSGRGESQVEIPVKNGWVTPMDHRAVSQRFARMGGFGGDSGTQLAPPRYEGRAPSNYTMVQTLNQWMPQLNRSIHIPVKSEETPIDWERLKVRMSASELAEAVPEGAGVFWLVGSTVHTVSAGAVEREMDTVNPHYRHDYYHGQSGTHLLRDFLVPLTVHSAHGLFAVTTAVSPGTAPTFEDLALSVRGEPAPAVMIVVERRGDEWIVYRKQYPGSEFR